MKKIGLAVLGLGVLVVVVWLIYSLCTGGDDDKGAEILTKELEGLRKQVEDEIINGGPCSSVKEAYDRHVSLIGLIDSMLDKFCKGFKRDFASFNEKFKEKLRSDPSAFTPDLSSAKAELKSLFDTAVDSDGVTDPLVLSEKLFGYISSLLKMLTTDDFAKLPLEEKVAGILIIGEAEGKDLAVQEIETLIGDLGRFTDEERSYIEVLALLPATFSAAEEGMHALGAPHTHTFTDIIADIIPEFNEGLAGFMMLEDNEASKLAELVKGYLEAVGKTLDTCSKASQKTLEDGLNGKGPRQN
jgi:hypothetical protein